MIRGQIVGDFHTDMKIWLNFLNFNGSLSQTGALHRFNNIIVLTYARIGCK